MRTNFQLLLVGMLLATVASGFSQPVITNQPETQAVAPGANVTFTVGARGTEPIAYQWQRNQGTGFSDLADGTNAVLALRNVQPWDAWDYRVLVTNLTGARTSTVAHLYVMSPALLTKRTVIYNFDGNDLTNWDWVTSGNYFPTNQQLTVRGYYPGVRTISIHSSFEAGGCPTMWPIADGQTREFRVDLVRIDETAKNHAILVVGNASLGSAYAVQKGLDYVYIDKFLYSANRFCIFACDRVPVRNTNIVLAFALTRSHANLLLTARLLDRADPNTVLYQHTVVDTPGIDPTLSAAQFQTLTGMKLLDLGPDAAVVPPYSSAAYCGVFQYTDGAAPAVLATFDNLKLWTYRVPIVRYVDAASANPTPPYTNWLTAANVIQDAVDAATPGDIIILTNGIYATGGRAVGTNLLVNRVAVEKPLTLRSVNGPEFTAIEGYQVPGTTNGDGAIRCVYLADGASLSGFTLTKGATRTNGDMFLDQSGGGVWCESTNAMVSDCLVTANSAYCWGGGAYGGTVAESKLIGNSSSNEGGGVGGSQLINCKVVGNSTQHSGGGAVFCTLNNCNLTSNNVAGVDCWGGGGAMDCMLTNCTLANNWSEHWGGGGGAFSGVLVNCTLTGNSAYLGGGASGYSNSLQPRHCYLYNCTLRNNHAQYGGGVRDANLHGCTLSGNSALQNGGGAVSSTLTNCTLTVNSALASGGGASYSTLANCTLTGNSSHDAGGAYASTLNSCLLTDNSAAGAGGGVAGGMQNNCTLTGNAAATGGGAAWANLNNSIVYFNTAALGTNCDSLSTLNYSCTTPLPASGVGNIASDPQLASASHLSATSPCRGAGSAAYCAADVDIDGEPWGNPPSMGCDEYQAGVVTGPLNVGMIAAFSYVPVGFPVAFTALIEGRTTGSVWEFGDGVVVSNRAWASHAWTSPGDYTVVLRAYNESYPQGVSATQTIHILTHSIYDPLVAEILSGIERPELVRLMNQLTGAEAAPVGEQLYTISTRCTVSGEPIEKATQFAFEQLQAFGLQAQYQDWTGKDWFQDRVDTNRNVIGVQPGAVHSTELVVIAAHFDDLPDIGWAPGADDNASGSAAVLTAARVLSRYRFDRSIHFVLFTGEEQGLLGSARYTMDALQGHSNIVAALVADMIGCRAGSPPFCSVSVWGSEGQLPLVNTWLAGWFNNVVANYGLSGRLGQPAIGTLMRLTSDQDEFWYAGLPAVLVEDLGSADIHSTDDTLAALDFDYLEAMVQAIVGTAAHLAGPLGRNPVNPVLGAVVAPSSGAVQLTLTGLAGRTYSIQASTDLAEWLTLTHLTLTTTTGQFLDTSAANFSRRFYRAVIK